MEGPEIRPEPGMVPAFLLPDVLWLQHLQCPQAIVLELLARAGSYMPIRVTEKGPWCVDSPGVWTALVCGEPAALHRKSSLLHRYF